VCANTIAPDWRWPFLVVWVLAVLVTDFVALEKRGAREVSVEEAIDRSIVWVAVSLAFNGLFWWAIKGSTSDFEPASDRALESMTGQLIEKSLSIDDVFVFLMMSTYLAVPPACRRRVLLIGVVGAIALRTVMVRVGGWLIPRLDWILYVFGAFLAPTGIKMWRAAGKEPDLANNPALRLLRRLIPVATHLDGERSTAGENGRRMATTLPIVLALVSVTDVIVAVESIPVIFAITPNPFIVLRRTSWPPSA